MACDRGVAEEMLLIQRNEEIDVRIQGACQDMRVGRMIDEGSGQLELAILRRPNHVQLRSIEQQRQVTQRLWRLLSYCGLELSQRQAATQ
jgi:hypothetical protein